jgi:hypothetical protein
MKRLVLILIAGAMAAGSLSAVMIDDFEVVSDWGAGGSRGAFSSVSADAAEAQVGNYAGSFNYSLSEDTGNDYVDFYNDTLSLDMTGLDTLKFKANLPGDSDMIVQLRFHSATGGFIEYNFAMGDDTWQDYELSISGDFTDYGTNPDLSNVNLVIFRANGDVSANATSGSILVDQMELVPEPTTLALLGGGLMLLRRKRKI